MSQAEDWADELSALLDEFSDRWKAPEELRQPTRYPIHNLVIQILTGQALGTDGIDLLGRILSEDALFNAWFYHQKGKAEPRELFELSHLRNDCNRRFHSSWVNYIKAYEQGGRREGIADQKEAALLDVMRSVIATLRDARSGPSEASS